MLTRRELLAQAGRGIGSVAVASMLGGASLLAGAPNGLPNLPHFRPKAKRAIYLFMAGGPSQIDIWDYKPKLREMFDKDLPGSVRGGQRLTTMTSRPEAASRSRPPSSSSRSTARAARGSANCCPHTAEIVDDIALVKSVHTEAINHDPAITLRQTGQPAPGPAEPRLVAELRPRQR